MNNDLSRHITKEDIVLLNGICAGRSVAFAVEFTACIPQVVEIVSKSILPKQWVEGWERPELLKQDDTDCLQSKEVFFELNHTGGTYHGWYIARPVDKSGQYFYEEESENIDIEYEYFFNANVGDELFDEDSIKRWMYVPEGGQS